MASESSSEQSTVPVTYSIMNIIDTLSNLRERVNKEKLLALTPQSTQTPDNNNIPPPPPPPPLPTPPPPPPPPTTNPAKMPTVSKEDTYGGKCWDYVVVGKKPPSTVTREFPTQTATTASPSPTPETTVSTATLSDDFVFVSGEQQITKTEEKGTKEADQSVGVDPLNQLDHDLIYMKYALNRLKNFQGKFGKSIQELKDDLELILSSQATRKYDNQDGRVDKDEIRRITQKFLNLKSKIPPVNRDSSDDLEAQQRRRINHSKDLPNMPDKEKFKKHGFYEEFVKKFDDLDSKSKDCLLCFAVFPEDAVIKKRLLRHWWMGEGLVEKRVENPNEVAVSTGNTVKKNGSGSLWSRRGDRSQGKGMMSKVITAEKVADELLQLFEEKGFIVSVDKKHREVANSFKMNPLARSAVITLAMRNKFVHFDSEGIPTLIFQDYKRACLVYDQKEGSLPLRLDQSAIRLAAWDLLRDKKIDEDKQKASKFVESMALFNYKEKQEQRDEEFAKIMFNLCGKANSNLTLDEVEKKTKEFADKRENIETLFNISEEFPEFTYDWFSKLKNIRVLYLGRWQSTLDDIPHIEIECIDEETGIEYLKGFNNMKSLKLLSFQGVSGIQKLPSEILKLGNLEILDLRACYNLDELPDDIDKLSNLTHLDISECFLLDGIPKKLSSLTKLQVLKGFVISDSDKDDYRRKPWCILKDLEKLEHLRKLNININSKISQDLSVVLKFKGLLSLKVSWGGGSSNPKTVIEDGSQQFIFNKMVTMMSKTFKGNKSVEITEPDIGKLEKLDLQCYPDENLPKWVRPSRLPQLKRFYIRGGRLNRLSEDDRKADQWREVQVLRLKYLNELKTDWTGLQNLFPKLNYLEKFKCHKVTLSPSDGNGVWEKCDLINLRDYSKKQHHEH